MHLGMYRTERWRNIVAKLHITGGRQYLVPIQDNGTMPHRHGTFQAFIDTNVEKRFLDGHGRRKKRIWMTDLLLNDGWSADAGQQGLYS